MRTISCIQLALEQQPPAASMLLVCFVTPPLVEPQKAPSNHLAVHQPYALSHVLRQPHQHLTAVSVTSEPEGA
jgi:hypothetical protein